MLNALMYKDPEVRKEYKLLSMQSALGADDVDGHVELIQEMLRGNKVEAELDQLTMGVNKSLTTPAAPNADASPDIVGRSASVGPVLSTSHAVIDRTRCPWPAEY